MEFLFPFQIDDVRRREVGFGCKCFQDVLIIREKKNGRSTCGNKLVL